MSFTTGALLPISSFPVLSIKSSWVSSVSPDLLRRFPTNPLLSRCTRGRRGLTILQVQESHRLCELFQGLSKGQYARVQLREQGGDGTTTGRYVLYVHDVLPPTPSYGPGARLVVTKYSFLADRLAWEAGHLDTQA